MPALISERGHWSAPMACNSFPHIYLSESSTVSAEDYEYLTDILSESFYQMWMSVYKDHTCAAQRHGAITQLAHTTVHVEQDTLEMVAFVMVSFTTTFSGRIFLNTFMIKVFWFFEWWVDLRCTEK